MKLKKNQVVSIASIYSKNVVNRRLEKIIERKWTLKNTYFLEKILFSVRDRLRREPRFKTKKKQLGLYQGFIYVHRHFNTR